MPVRAKIKDSLRAYMQVQKTNLDTAARSMAESIIVNSRITAPMLTGALRSDGRVEGNQGKYGAIFGDERVPYARAQEFGTNGIVVFRNYTTPGTGSHYLKNAGDKVAERGIEVFIK